MRNFAVIFDMDGLMLDTERMARKAWTQALAETGYLLDEAAYLGLVGHTVADAEQILVDMFGAELPFGPVFQKRQQYYELDIEKNGIPIKPGLLPLLDFLEQKQVTTAVATSTPCWFARQKLERSQLRQRFSTVVCAEDVARGKPAPDLFIEAARRIGVPASRCVVLEDSEAGILAAHAAGMLPVMIPDLKQPSEQVGALAYRVLPDLHAVRVLVETLLADGLPHPR